MEKIDRPFDGEKPRDRYYTDDEIKMLWLGADAAAEKRKKEDPKDRTGEVRAAFLKVLLLTGCRRGELAGMRWSEIDSDGLWTIPPERFKASATRR